MDFNFINYSHLCKIHLISSNIKTKTGKRVLVLGSRDLKICVYHDVHRWTWLVWMHVWRACYFYLFLKHWVRLQSDLFSKFEIRIAHHIHWEFWILLRLYFHADLLFTLINHLDCIFITCLPPSISFTFLTILLRLQANPKFRYYKIRQ